MPEPTPDGARLVRISFIVPAHNELATIEEVLERVHTLPLEKQVIAVYDGSSDGTGDVLERWRKQLGIVLVRQPHSGKGAAIRAAIPHVEGETSRTPTWSTTRRMCRR